MNYKQLKILCDKYNIICYTDNGNIKTYNKLIHIINDHENKKHKLSQKQKIYNSIDKYLSGGLSDLDLDMAMHHYIGN